MIDEKETFSWSFTIAACALVLVIAMIVLAVFEQRCERLHCAQGSPTWMVGKCLCLEVAKESK